VNRNNHFQGETRMSDSNERPAAEIKPPQPSLSPAPPAGQIAGGPDASPGTRQGNHGAAGNHDLTVELKRRLEETRLPADLREQVLAALPSLSEQERLYRELQEKGGLSSEQFMDSLGVEVEPRS
jgi:hypothetical protein